MIFFHTYYYLGRGESERAKYFIVNMREGGESLVFSETNGKNKNIKNKKQNFLFGFLLPFDLQKKQERI